MPDALILSAGQGNRLLDITGGKVPKCLLSAGNENILERMLRQLKAYNIKKIIVVIGQGGCWTSENQKKVISIGCEVVINEKSLDSETPLSLWLGMERLKTSKDVIFLDGDVVFEDRVLEDLLFCEKSAVMVTRTLESAWSSVGSKVLFDRNRKITKVDRELVSHYLNTGILRFRGDALECLRKCLTDPGIWVRQWHELLTEYLRFSELYSLCLKSYFSELQPRRFYQQTIWEQYPRMIEFESNQVKKYANIGAQKLIAEVLWLRKLPPQARPFFPEVNDSLIEGPLVWYSMPRYPMRDLSSIVLDQKIDPEILSALLKNILLVLSKSLYSGQGKDPEPGYIRYGHLEKIRSRLTLAAGYSELFRKVSESPRLRINGRDLPGLKEIFEWLDHNVSFLAMMEPPRLCLAHSDLKFDNILLDIDSLKFRLIDPRGKSPLGEDYDDPAIDAAKLMTSGCGFQEFFCSNFIPVEVNAISQGTLITYDRSNIDSWLSIVEGLTKEAIKFASQINPLIQDIHWEKRAYFLSSLILIAFAPYHLITTQGTKAPVSVGLLARGLEMLMDSIEAYSPSLEQGYTLFNVNTTYDYDLVCQIWNQDIIQNKFPHHIQRIPEESDLAEVILP